MTAFTAAVAAIFADPNFAEAGVYTPQGGGAAVAVTVVRARTPGQGVGGARAGAHAQSEVAEMRQGDLASVTPRRGDRLEIGGTVYWIDAPMPDDTAGTWRFDLAERG